MRRVVSFFLIVFIAGTLAACGDSPWSDKRPDLVNNPSIFGSEFYKPRAARKVIFRNTPSGDDPYSQGWRDGCDTALSVVGSGLYQLIPAKIDPNRMTNDPWYLRGYRDGSSWCTFRIDWMIME